jgi:hypothetical protein
MSMHRYALYGLTLESNRELGGLAPARRTAGFSPPGRAEARPTFADIVRIEFAGPLEPQPETRPFWSNGFEMLWHLDRDSWLLAYHAAGIEGYRWTVRYDGGTRVTVRWDSDELLADIPAVLQGPGIAASLHLRDIPLLHACAIDVGGSAILLMGVPGAGKSTAAAALVRAGFPLVSDDLAALSLRGDDVLVQPGYPRLRLFADSAQAAGFAPSQLSRAFVSPLLGDKQFVDVSGGSFTAEPLPLRAMYILQPRRPDGGDPVVTRIDRGAAWPLLAQNIYALRFLDPERRFRAVRDTVAIAARVPLCSVQAGDDLTALPRLVEVLTRAR